ncbi:GNAT family N-acetyltransferase [Modestobacter roseus]|uniref:GNAT family N-acetyltransferase n=1 Tax=Modestobacter roseus TaxID=1181884 RepID=UPI0034DDFA58
MLRPATAADAELLFSWANDPETRARSFSGTAITWSDHLRWFTALLADTERALWLLESDGRAVASIRFEPFGDRARVSVQVAPGERGQGHGRRVVAEASALYVSASGRGLLAEVKPDNAASIAVFEAAGFHRAADQVDGARRYLLEPVRSGGDGAD